jgi:hypothetical protein
MKRIVPIVILLVLFCTAGMVISGCSKSKLSSFIIGRWHRVNVINVDSVFVEDWDFQPGGTLVIHHAPEGAGDTLNLTGTYAVVSYNKFSINIPDDHWILLNGVWQIARKKDGYMMAVIDLSQFDGAGGGLTFREFTR